MKRQLAAFLVASTLIPVTAYAVFAHRPLKAPVKANDVGEIMFKRADWSANNSEYVKMNRDEFLRFFKEGIFRNDINELVYESDHFQKPLNKKGGWQYCSGAFATKNGKVFFWKRPRIGVLEITNNQYHTGWLVLPVYMKQETPNQEPQRTQKPRR